MRTTKDIRRTISLLNDRTVVVKDIPDTKKITSNIVNPIIVTTNPYLGDLRTLLNNLVLYVNADLDPLSQFPACGDEFEPPNEFFTELGANSYRVDGSVTNSEGNKFSCNDFGNFNVFDFTPINPVNKNYFLVSDKINIIHQGSHSIIFLAKIEDSIPEKTFDIYSNGLTSTSFIGVTCNVNYIDPADGKLTVSCYRGVFSTLTYNMVISSGFPALQWNLVIITFDNTGSGEAKTRVNGVLKSTVVRDNPVSTSPATTLFNIGRNSGGINLFAEMDGKIQFLAITTDVITPAEIFYIEDFYSNKGFF